MIDTNQAGLRSSWTAVRLVLPIFKKYRTSLIFGFAALLGVDFLQLSIPRVIKRAIDSLQAGVATHNEMLILGLVVISLAVGIAVCRFVWRYLLLGFSRRLERDIRDDLFKHVLGLDRAFFQRRTVGELMALAGNDLAAVQLAGGMGIVACVDAIVMTVAAVSFMAYIHPGLTIIAVLPLPVLALLTRVLSSRLHKRFRRVQEHFSRLTEFARTSLSSIRLIKAYTQEKVQSDIFGSMGREYVQDNLKLAVVQGILWPFSGLTANLCMLLVLFFGGSLTINGVITAGDFVAFITYLLMLTWPMMAIGWVINLFQRGATSLERIQSVLLEKPALKEPVGSQQLPLLCSSMAVRNLTFTYPGQHTPVLHDVSLEIGTGLTGVVGRTGSGKSTLCHLLARLYAVQDSKIFLENIDINTLPLDLVRKVISYVPQEVFLFSDTIRANISMGKPDAGREEIEQAARSVFIHDEIMAMPGGYDTVIGERGVLLSGGQRQRLCLARALLMNRPVIIIDDALSAVDTQTEHNIISSITPYLKGRTCLLVSHRVAPLIDADRIIVMERGMIVAEGRHEQLLKEDGFYAAIYAHQTASSAVK